MKKNVFVYAGLVLALVSVIIITTLSYLQMNRLAVQEQAEDYTFAVIQNLDRLTTDLRAARTDTRDYARSGERRFLEAYREANRKVQSDLAELTLQTRGRPQLEQRLREIERLVRERLAVLEKALDAGEAGPSAGTGPGTNRGEAIRTQVAAAKEEAVALMREVNARQEADYRRMEKITIADSVIMFALFLMIYLLLRRDIARRIRSEAELLRHRDRLEEEVQARTRELVEANRSLTSEVAEREQAEAALRAKEKRYRSLFENSLDAVLLTDSRGAVISANLAACDMFGMTEEELTRTGLEGVVDPSDGRFAVAIEKRARSGWMFSELGFIRKDGSSLTGEVSSTVLDDDATSFVIVHDITERKWAEQIKRNLGEYEDTIQEQERLDLSRKVHDEIGQNLTALKIDLSWIERHLAMGNDDELAGRINEMRAGLDGLIVKAQQITADLRPPLLDSLGLAAAVEWQAAEFQRRSGIECHRMLNEEIEVADEHAAATIMRILREALTNVVRHAGATEVSISLCRRGDGIVLEISDNGRGITVTEIHSPTAYGIMGMRERAEHCNWKLEIAGLPGEGTTLVLTIPNDGIDC